MTEKCFDEGTIQAFLDGELAHEISQKVTRHIAVCDVCAFTLAEAEEETALAFSALEREFDTLVPTNRLWTKINDSIVEENKQTSVWQRILSLVSVSLMSPSMAVAAGILIFVGVFAVVLSVNNKPDSGSIAATTGETNSTSINQVNQTAPTSVEQKIEIANSSPIITVAEKTKTQKSKIYQASNRQNTARNEAKNLTVNANYTEKKQPVFEDQKPKIIYSDYLPGEETYVKTIADLSQSVEGQKDAVLRPSARISFERDLAVVNDAINKMKREVRRNPKNDSAKQVLYSSYQNKIDLLNSVAEKTELMASLK